jgi:hypothetical protein
LLLSGGSPDLFHFSVTEESNQQKTANLRIRHGHQVLSLNVVGSALPIVEGFGFGCESQWSIPKYKAAMQGVIPLMPACGLCD